MSKKIDKALINNLAKFASLIYTMFEKEEYTIPEGYQEEKRFYSEVRQNLHHEKEMIAAVFRKKGTKEYTITFRGTDSKKDAIYDVLFPLVDFKKKDGNPVSGVKVHSGFYDLYTNEKGWGKDKSSLRYQLWHWLNHDVQLKNVSKLFVTGHSLGCSLATLFVYDLFNDGAIKCPVVYYNFASPMVGNHAFCDDFMKYVNNSHSTPPSLTAVRIFNGRDLVPKLPGKLVDAKEYSHFGSSYEINFCWKDFKDQPEIGSHKELKQLLHELWEYIKGHKEELDDELLRVLMCHSMDNYHAVCTNWDKDDHFIGDFQWTRKTKTYPMVSFVKKEEAI